MCSALGSLVQKICSNFTCACDCSKKVVIIEEPANNATTGKTAEVAKAVLSSLPEDENPE